jgi:hypothetical protein
VTHLSFRPEYRGLVYSFVLRAADESLACSLQRTGGTQRAWDAQRSSNVQASQEEERWQRRCLLSETSQVEVVNEQYTYSSFFSLPISVLGHGYNKLSLCGRLSFMFRLLSQWGNPWLSVSEYAIRRREQERRWEVVCAVRIEDIRIRILERHRDSGAPFPLFVLGVD